MYKSKSIFPFVQLISFIITTFPLFAQTASPTITDRGKIHTRRISKLPELLKECSGIIALDSNRIWAINDGGNRPILYLLDPTGSVIDSIEVKGAENIDWEDMTSDGKHFYIGDFGNNMNIRKSFQIYKIPIPSSGNGEQINAEKIEYTYDSAIVPLPSHKLNYDVESLIVLNDTAYLFSKNRTRPFDGMVYIYQLPINSPNPIATKYDSLFLGSGRMIDYWISSAALSLDKRVLVLISYSKMWLFECISGSNFFNGKATTFDFGFTSQKESISFVNQHILYLTDENFFPFSEGALYSLDISSYLINECK